MYSRISRLETSPKGVKDLEEYQQWRAAKSERDSHRGLVNSAVQDLEKAKIQRRQVGDEFDKVFSDEDASPNKIAAIKKRAEDAEQQIPDLQDKIQRLKEKQAELNADVEQAEAALIQAVKPVADELAEEFAETLQKAHKLSEELQQISKHTRDIRLKFIPSYGIARKKLGPFAEEYKGILAKWKDYHNL